MGINTNAIPSAQPNTNGAYAAIKARQGTSDATPTSSADISSFATISDAARKLANEQGIPVPDSIAQMFNKDFPADIMQEAQARLDDVKANGRLGANGPMNLPLLPENQKLLDSFQQEMNSISSAGLQNTDPAQSGRFNLLMNLSMRLQLTGWQKPMTEADVQREFDISNAMAKLSINDPALAPSSDPEKSLMDSLANIQSGAVPTVWHQRWQSEGLTMPENVAMPRNSSVLLDAAKAAGISENDFLSKLRELAGDKKGNSLTSAIESFISDRYVALLESQKALTTSK